MSLTYTVMELHMQYFSFLMFVYFMNLSKLFNCLETRAGVKVFIFKFTLLVYNNTFLEKWCWLSDPSVLPNVKSSALKVIWLLKYPYLNEALKSFIQKNSKKNLSFIYPEWLYLIYSSVYLFPPRLFKTIHINL